METRVAVVTGGNRGIGLEIGRQLAGRGIRVVLTARDQAKGEQAAATLLADGLDVRFHPLDVSEPISVRRLVKWLADDLGRLDILVNNAAIYADDGVPGLEVDLALVRQTMETNFYGPLRLCQMVVPLMRRHGHGRIVNLSSGMGALSGMGGRSLGYRISKTALNALTRIVAAELRDTNILVNAVDPGWVKTEMGGPGANRSLAQGADTPVWLATLPDGGPSGGFYRDRRPAAW
jgi:NAD(P)-dependent dehydrogenase (short-subunit alcohol dehydrogenase family)